MQAAGVAVWSRAVLDVASKAFGTRRGVDMMRDILPRFLWPRGRVWAIRMPTERQVDLGTPLRYARFVVRQYAGARLGEDAATGIVALLGARRVFLAGNGGACAVAQHATVDWQKAGGRDVTALADPVVNSAWANDHGYVCALARQVERVRDPRECALVLFSASGSSPNVVEAAKRTRELGWGTVLSVSRADSAAPLHQAAMNTMVSHNPSIKFRSCSDKVMTSKFPQK